MEKDLSFPYQDHLHSLALVELQLNEQPNNTKSSECAVHDSSVRWGWRYQTRILIFFEKNLIQAQKIKKNKRWKNKTSLSFFGGVGGMRCFFLLVGFCWVFCWTFKSLLSSHTVEVTKELWMCNCKSPERMPGDFQQCYGKKQHFYGPWVCVYIYIYM